MSTCDIVFKLDATSRATTLGSNSGTIYFGHTIVPSVGRFALARQPHGWRMDNLPATWIPRRFSWSSTPGGDNFTLPYWLPVLSCSALAFIVWIPSRFSLKALLLATALVAVHLGAAVWFWQNT